MQPATGSDMAHTYKLLYNSNLQMHAIRHRKDIPAIRKLPGTRSIDTLHREESGKGTNKQFGDPAAEFGRNIIQRQPWDSPYRPEYPPYRIYRAMFTPVAKGAGNRCIAEKLRTGQLVKRIFWKGACSEGMLCTVINGPKGRRGKRACYTSDMVTRNKNIRLVAKPGVSGYVKDGKRSFGRSQKGWQ